MSDSGFGLQVSIVCAWCCVGLGRSGLCLAGLMASLQISPGQNPAVLILFMIQKHLSGLRGSEKELPTACTRNV